MINLEGGQSSPEIWHGKDLNDLPKGFLPEVREVYDDLAWGFKIQSGLATFSSEAPLKVNFGAMPCRGKISIGATLLEVANNWQTKYPRLDADKNVVGEDYTHFDTVVLRSIFEKQPTGEEVKKLFEVPYSKAQYDSAGNLIAPSTPSRWALVLEAVNDLVEQRLRVAQPAVQQAPSYQVGSGLHTGG